MPRRKAGTLLPIELSILDSAIELRVRGAQFFHGFMIAREIKERDNARLLTAHGTLYKALDRMEKSGLLASEWEDPVVAAQEGRPRRRFYSVTAAGEAALTRARAAPGLAAIDPKRGLATP
jgi:DNA-binding PadR family transcriptional regulator